MKLLQAQGVKEKPGNIFPSLDKIYNRPNTDKKMSKHQLKGVLGKILAAKGGEKLND